MNKKILFVSHDANRAGSQLLLLQLLKILKQKRVPMELLLCDGGVVTKDFDAVLPTIRLPKNDHYVVRPLGDKLLCKIGFSDTLQRRAENKRDRKSTRLNS